MSLNSNYQKKTDADVFNIFILGFFLFIILGKDSKKFSITNKLSLKEIDIKNIEKKAMLLNRIKGYMDTEEQRIIHRAEILLHLIGNTKQLFETNELVNAEIRNNSFSIDDRMRNMLMDLSEFVHEDKRHIIHKAIDLDIQAKGFGNKIKEIQTLNIKGKGLSVEHIEKYVDIFEPFLDKEISDKVKEGKRLLSMLKLYKSIEEKGEISELDIIEMIKPYIPEEQRENLGRMLDIMKVVSNMSNTEKTTKENELESQQQNNIDEKPSDNAYGS